MEINKKVNREFGVYERGLGEELKHFQHNEARYIWTIKTLAKLKKEPPKTILDIGTSPLTILLKRLFSESEIVTADLTSKYKFEAEKNKIKFVKIDLNKESLLVLKRKFDIVLFLEVAEHLKKSPENILNQIEKILKPGGFCIVQTPNRNSLRTKFFKFQTQFSLKPGEIHFKEYTQGEFMTLIREKTNFEVVDADYYLYYDYPSSTIVYRKIKPLAFPLLIVNLLIVAIFPRLRRGMQFILKKDE